MSLDLTLLPLDGDIDFLQFSRTLLPLSTNCYDLFEAIKKLLKSPTVSIEFIKDTELIGTFSKGIYAYLAPRGENQDQGYGLLKEDAYGKPVKWILASYLYSLNQLPQVKDNFKNRAAWAYLAQLPANTKIVLYWH